jgi:hypothetical protein
VSKRVTKQALCMYIRPRGLFATKLISVATISELVLTALLDIGNTCNIYTFMYLLVRILVLKVVL